jgi:hypothetical protein
MEEKELKDKEFYKTEISRMLGKINDTTMLFKIYSFVRVFFESI